MKKCINLAYCSCSYSASNDLSILMNATFFLDNLTTYGSGFSSITLNMRSYYSSSESYSPSGVAVLAGCASVPAPSIILTTVSLTLAGNVTL